MVRVSNRQTACFLVNIKARENQTEEHYVEVFRKLSECDPMIKFPRGKYGSLKSINFSEIKDENDGPKWIQINLLSYTLIDPDAFYDKKNKEDVHIDNLGEDVVANKKETEIYFIPSVHTLAVKCNAKITLKNVLSYFSEALNIVEPEMFDVDVIVEQDVLNKII